MSYNKDDMKLCIFRLSKWDHMSEAGRTVFSANEVARSAAATSEAWGDVSMLRTDSTWLSSCKRGWARGPPPTDPCESELLLRLAGVSTPDRTVPFCMVEGWCELAPSEYASAERVRLPEELMISKSSKRMRRKWSVAIEIFVQDALAVGVRYPYLTNLLGSRRGQAFRARPLSESLSQLSLVKPGKAIQAKNHMTR